MGRIEPIESQRMVLGVESKPESKGGAEMDETEAGISAMAEDIKDDKEETWGGLRELGKELKRDIEHEVRG